MQDLVLELVWESILRVKLQALTELTIRLVRSQEDSTTTTPKLFNNVNGITSSYCSFTYHVWHGLLGRDGTRRSPTAASIAKLSALESHEHI